MLGVLALFVFYALSVENRSGLVMTSTELSPVNEDSRLVNLRITGRTQDAAPYVLTAQAASHGRETPDQIDLEVLELDLQLEPGGWLLARAGKGMFLRKQARLELGRPLDLYSTAGYELHARRAVIDLKKGELTVPAAVRGHGPLGRFEAGGLKAAGRGRQLLFHGGVKVQLRLPPPRAAAAPQGAQP